MADRTVKLVLTANVANLQARLKAAQSSVNEFAGKLDKQLKDNRAAVDTLSNSVGAIGLAAVGAAGVVVARFADFDKAMSSVQASTRATGSELESLRSAALRAGADTAFSAAEAAGAIDELAKAGVSSADILSGGLSGALSLAAAGQIDVAEAAELSASALTQFELKGSDVGHVADLLAAGAGKAQGSVSDLGQALNQAGLIANQIGLSIEETSGALGAFANAGLLGSDAGTSFKTMLQVLAAPTDVAREQMDELGISAYNAQGNFVGLEKFAGQLRVALEDKTDAERSSALATIFGSDAVRAATVIYEQGARGIESWIEKVDDAGFAAENAAIQMDNLSGDVDKLLGSLDSVFIQSGSGANDFLRDAVQNAEDFVDAIGQIPAPVLNIMTLLVGGGGLALLGAAGLGKLAVAGRDAFDAMDELGLRTEVARSRMGTFVKGATIAVGALGALATAAALAASSTGDVGQGIEEIYDGLDQLADGASTTETVFKNVAGSFGTLQSEGVAFSDLVHGLADPNLWERINGGVSNFAVGVGNLFGADWRAGWQEQRDALAAFDEQLGMLASQRLPAAQDAFRQLFEEAGGTQQAGLELLEVMPGLRDALIGVANGAGLATDDATLLKIALGDVEIAQEGATDATRDATSATRTQTEVIRDNWEAQVQAANALLGLRDAQRGFRQAIRDASDAVKDNGRTLDITTSKGRANEAALDGIASAGWRMVESAREQGATQGELRSKMVAARDAFLDTAEKMGLARGKAKELADELGLIPSNIAVQITLDATQAAADLAWFRQQATVRAKIDDGRNRTQMAHGGPVVGGTPGRDSVPILGMPGEHMLTVRDVQAMGGHAGVYAWRAALHGGVQAMANGGAVGAAQRDVERWRGELRSARAALRTAGKTAAERDDVAAERRVERAERALDEARSRRSRLREEAADLRTSLRRGDLRDQVTGGLSGAYGAVDQLRDLADSGDLGRGRANRLRGVAGQAERELRGLYTAAERAEKQLGKARDRLDELRQIQSGVQSSIVGGFGFDSVRGEFDPATGKRVASGAALASAAKQYAGKAKRFGSLLERLRKASGSAAIVQEVAGYGVEEGVPLAQSLLSDLPSLKSLAASLDDIQRFGARAGAAVAHAVGGQSITDAQQDARRAQAQVKAIDKEIDGWAKKIGAETARALGVKPRAMGGDAMPGNAYIAGEYGRELILPQYPQYVLSAEATRRLASSGSQYGGGTVSTTYSDHLTVNNYGPELTDQRLLRFSQKRRMLEGVRR